MKMTTIMALTASAAAFLAAALLFTSCSNPKGNGSGTADTKNGTEMTSPEETVRPAVPSIRRVGAEEFAEIIKDSSVVVVDVRTAGEHAEGCIEGTDYNMDVLENDFTEKVRTLPSGKEVAIYCRSGNRSRKAAEILCKEGFQVYELATGYKGWLSFTGR